MTLAAQMLDALAWISLGALCAFAVMVVLNHQFAARLDKAPPLTGSRMPRVSVLIPVRQESVNLRRHLPSILASDYPGTELIILDDDSADDSVDVASSLVAGAPFPARVVRGALWSPSSGLSGKAHACDQLARIASQSGAEILIFCDADVTVSPRTISLTVSWLLASRCAGVTALPAQACAGWRERLVIPWIMHLPILASVPLFYSWRSPVPSMQIANGQWLAVRSADYFAAGGHSQLGATPLEDVALARAIHQKTGRGIRPLIAARDIRAGMYPDWPAMLSGFSKNLVALGGGSPRVFTFLLVVVNVVFLFPLWGFFCRADLAAYGIAALLLTRTLAARIFCMPLRDLIWHPVGLMLLNRASLVALRTAKSGAYQWKNRVVEWSGT